MIAPFLIDSAQRLKVLVQLIKTLVQDIKVLVQDIKIIVQLVKTIVQLLKVLVQDIKVVGRFIKMTGRFQTVTGICLGKSRNREIRPALAVWALGGGLDGACVSNPSLRTRSSGWPYFLLALCRGFCNTLK